MGFLKVDQCCFLLLELGQILGKFLVEVLLDGLQLLLVGLLKGLDVFSQLLHFFLAFLLVLEEVGLKPLQLLSLLVGDL